MASGIVCVALETVVAIGGQLGRGLAKVSEESSRAFTGLNDGPNSMLCLVPVFLELNIRSAAGDRNGGVRDILHFCQLTFSGHEIFVILYICFGANGVFLVV